MAKLNLQDTYKRVVIGADRAVALILTAPTALSASKRQSTV